MSLTWTLVEHHALASCMAMRQKAVKVTSASAKPCIEQDFKLQSWQSLKNKQTTEKTVKTAFTNNRGAHGISDFNETAIRLPRIEDQKLDGTTQHIWWNVDIRSGHRKNLDHISRQPKRKEKEGRGFLYIHNTHNGKVGPLQIVQVFGELTRYFLWKNGTMQNLRSLYGNQARSGGLQMKRSNIMPQCRWYFLEGMNRCL